MLNVKTSRYDGMDLNLPLLSLIFEVTTIQNETILSDERKTVSSFSTISATGHENGCTIEQGISTINL